MRTFFDVKILIFSDSHGQTDRMRRWIEQEQPDHLIHLGDFYDDLPSALRVPGNCDPYKLGARVKVVTLAGVRIFLTHGHKHGVKLSLNELIRSASEAEARVVLFGHTHVPYVAEHDGMILMNPGSAVRIGLCVEIAEEIKVRFLGDEGIEKALCFPLS